MPADTTKSWTTQHPSVAVVIRNRNESQYLEPVLAALRAQTYQPQEIIVVDNESTDASVAVANAHSAKIVPISRAEFTYGRAINVGIAACRADTVLLLSAHCLPLGSGFISDAVNALVESGAAAVCCRSVRQIDNHSTWADRHIVKGEATWPEIWNHTIESRAALLRREVWEKIRFREDLESSEDRQWSREVLAAGYSIATSGAFYWYMRRTTLIGGVREFQRAMTSMYRLGGDIGSFSMGTVAGKTLHAWKNAVRSTLDSLLRYAVFKAVPYLASRRPKDGSLR
jgi:rhamnosyltransferase